MSATWELFERWMAAKKHESVRQGCLALGLKPQAATYWKQGRNADADVIERMAKDLGESPAQWTAKVMAQQSKGEAARAWGRIAKQLGAAAAVALVALLPYSARASAPGATLTEVGSIHYAKLWIATPPLNLAPLAS